jgi:hypothetical protein
MQARPESEPYRTEFWPVFLCVYIVGAVGGALFLPLWVWLDPTLSVRPHVVLEGIGYVAVFFSPPYAALCALFMSRYFTYFVTSEGIGGRSGSGKLRFVPWSQIDEVKPVALGNLRYVRVVTSDDSLPVWLPLFLRNAVDFDSRLTEHAPEDHVVRRLFRL